MQLTDSVKCLLISVIIVLAWVTANYMTFSSSITGENPDENFLKNLPHKPHLMVQRERLGKKTVIDSFFKPICYSS